MVTIKVANTPKDAGSESGADLQKIIAKFNPTDPSENTMRKMNSDFMKTHDLPSQANGIQIKTFKSVLSAGKEANTQKDAGSESGANLQEMIAEIKPPDPVVSSWKEKNSGLKILLMAFGTQLEPSQTLLKSK